MMYSARTKKYSECTACVVETINNLEPTKKNVHRVKIIIKTL